MSKLILCTGGAKSGKSVFAEKLALSLKGKKLYIATSQVFDEEMAEKVMLHKKRRGVEWDTYEISHNLSCRIKDIVQHYDVILIDCITMYITNQILQYDNFENKQQKKIIYQTIINEIDSILTAMQLCEHKIFIMVTNELGNGIVPIDAMTRLYRDIIGIVNQNIASVSDQVYLTISGITIELKEREVQLDG